MIGWSIHLPLSLISRVLPFRQRTRDLSSTNILDRSTYFRSSLSPLRIRSLVLLNYLNIINLTKKKWHRNANFLPALVRIHTKPTRTTYVGHAPCQASSFRQVYVLFFDEQLVNLIRGPVTQKVSAGGFLGI